MNRKLSNKEWDEYINQYYNLDTLIIINAFCKENNLSKAAKKKEMSKLPSNNKRC